MPEVHPYRWKLLEGHLNRLVTCLTDVRPIREGQPPWTLPFQSSLTYVILHSGAFPIICFSLDVSTSPNRA